MFKKALVVLLMCVFFLQINVAIAVNGNQDLKDFTSWFRDTDGITNQFFIPQEMKLGIKAFYLTVLQGTERSICELEYVGTVTHPLTAKERLYLFRIIGKPLEDVTAVAGMSGSPVYVKQGGMWRLMGAYAYSVNRFAPSKEYLAGVTPIQAMLDENSALGYSLKNGNAFSEKKVNSSFGKLNIKPLRNVFKSFNSRKADLSFLPVKEDLRPGDALSAVLAEGDFNFYATGTVTYIDYQKKIFLAFGHPLVRDLGLGQINVPAYRAEITTVALSYDDAHKEPARLLGRVGTITKDTIFSVAGNVGVEEPQTNLLPIAVSLKNGDKKSLYRFSVIRQQLLTPILMQMGLEELVLNAWLPPSEADCLIQAKATVFLTGYKEFSFQESQLIIPKAGKLFKKKMNELQDAMVRNFFNILNSQWNFKIEKVEMQFDLQSPVKILYLDSSFIFDSQTNQKIQSSIKPGQRILIVLNISNIDGSKRYILQIPYQVPADFEPDDDSVLTIAVQSGSNFVDCDLQNYSEFYPETPQAFLEYAQKVYGNYGGDPGKLYVQFVLPVAQNNNADQNNDAGQGQTRDGWQSVDSFKKEPLKIKFTRKLQIYDGPTDDKYIFDINFDINASTPIPITK